MGNSANARQGRRRSNDRLLTFAKGLGSFKSEYERRKVEMLTALKKLEETAKELDSVDKNGRIAGVVNSLAGAVGGVLTIVGLAATPLTAGASLALTASGLGLGVASGVGTLVTGAKECKNMNIQQSIAAENIRIFGEHLQKLQDCLKEVEEVINSNEYVAFGLESELQMIKGASMYMATELKVAFSIINILDDIGKVALKGAMGLSRSIRNSIIGLNALLVGVDIFCVVNDSVQLAQGCESQVAKMIRAQVEEWHSLMNSLKQLCDSAKPPSS